MEAPAKLALTAILIVFGVMSAIITVMLSDCIALARAAVSGNDYQRPTMLSKVGDAWAPVLLAVCGLAFVWGMA